MHRIEEELGCSALFVKRDDLLGRGLGGNKLRKLEYIFAKALSEGATSLITIGGFESNNIALLSILARMYKLRPIIVLMGPMGEKPHSINVAVLKKLNVETHIVRYEEDDFSSRATVRMQVDLKVEELVERLKVEGESPYYVPEGGCCLEGTYAFCGAFDELHSQMKANDMPSYDIYLPVGSGSSFAGIWCGKQRANADVKLIGISIALKKYRCCKEIIKAAERVCELISINPPSMDDLDVKDHFIGDGYGKRTEHSKRGVELALREEGLLLDHTYTGKALGAMLEIFRNLGPSTGRPVVFWHTGGMPGAIDCLVSG
jgi:1-aminocyclopropane-1-carboxylate deaminase/D-cysteine desulfhydrase-like pyridoxal-dependent ACC family enzyme